MGEISLIASAAFPPGIFPQDQAGCRPPKEFQALLPGQSKRQATQKSGCQQLNALCVEGPQQSATLCSEYNQPYSPDPMLKNPVLIDVQDARPDSVLFSFGIAEQCIRHEKVLKFLMSGSSIVDGEGLNVSMLSDLMGLDTVAIGMHPSPHVFREDEFGLYDADPLQFIHPQRLLYAPKPLLDFVGNLSHTSTITVHPGGRVLLTGSGAEMKDLLSIAAEFNLLKNTRSGSKQEMVVPYFSRWGRGHTRRNNEGSSLKFDTQIVAPLKSPESVKLKPHPKKKKNKKTGRERDLYSKNFFHAFESLLSVAIDKKRGKTALFCLKKSGPEVNQILSHLSSGIAGTGLAVLFSVAYKIASGRALSFCAAKFFNTGIGFGLFWLSWSVKRLQDSLSRITNKNSSSLKLKDEEAMAREVERSVNEVFFRAATLMAMTVLRFA